MEVIIIIVSLIGWIVDEIEFQTLFFYMELSITLWKFTKHFTNDKTTKR